MLSLVGNSHMTKGSKTLITKRDLQQFLFPLAEITLELRQLGGPDPAVFVVGQGHQTGHYSGRHGGALQEVMILAGNGGEYVSGRGADIGLRSDQGIGIGLAVPVGAGYSHDIPVRGGEP